MTELTYFCLNCVRIYFFLHLIRYLCLELFVHPPPPLSFFFFFGLKIFKTWYFFLTSY